MILGREGGESAADVGKPCSTATRTQQMPWSCFSMVFGLLCRRITKGGEDGNIVLLLENSDSGAFLPLLLWRLEPVGNRRKDSSPWAGRVQRPLRPTERARRSQFA